MTSSSQFKQRKNLPCEVQRFRFQCFINLYFTSIGHAGPTRNTGDAGRQGGPRCSAHLSPTVALSKHTLKAWENEPRVSDLGGKARPCRDRRAMASQGPFAGVRGGAQLPAGGQAASQGHGALAGACPRRALCWSGPRPRAAFTTRYPLTSALPEPLTKVSSPQERSEIYKEYLFVQLRSQTC